VYHLTQTETNLTQMVVTPASVHSNHHAHLTSTRVSIAIGAGKRGPRPVLLRLPNADDATRAVNPSPLWTGAQLHNSTDQ
jgi:hypothetical protein